MESYWTEERILEFATGFRTEAVRAKLTKEQLLDELARYATLYVMEQDAREKLDALLIRSQEEWYDHVVKSTTRLSGAADAIVKRLHVDRARAVESARVEAAHQSRSDLASKAATDRHANSKKGQQKALVRKCWEQWQLYPRNYRTKAEFARDMLKKFEESDQSIQSTRVIEGWCRQWERTA